MAARSTPLKPGPRPPEQLSPQALSYSGVLGVLGWVLPFRGVLKACGVVFLFALEVASLIYVEC